MGAREASGGGDDGIRRRLGGEPERREEPAQGVGLGHGAEHPPRAAAARTDQDLKREHAAQELGPRPASRDWGRRPRVGRRRRRDERGEPLAQFQRIEE
jgi:hypothetical protein